MKSSVLGSKRGIGSMIKDASVIELTLSSETLRYGITLFWL